MQGSSGKSLKRLASTQVPPDAVGYSGKLTRTGNSTGFRFEGALFKSHPEFRGRVRAQVISPGRMLVTAEDVEEAGSDPVIDAFLAFLQEDMTRRPQGLQPLSTPLLDEVAALTRGVVVDSGEDLGDAELL